MARLPGLFLRGGVWWLRVMVPVDLRLGLQGRTKVVRSLRTSDRRQASRLALLHRAALLSGFEQGCLDRVQAVSPPDVRSPVTTSHLGAVAPTPVAEVGPGSATRSASVGDPHPYRTLRSVYERWAALSEGAVDTKRLCARALALYEQWAGPKCPPIQEITRTQGHEFKAWLLEKSRSGEYASKTVHSFLVSICGLLRFAHQELEWTPRHCWRGIAIEYRYFTVHQGSNLTEATNAYAPSIHMAEALVRTISSSDPIELVDEPNKAWTAAGTVIASRAAPAKKKPIEKAKREGEEPTLVGQIDSSVSTKPRKGNMQTKWKGAMPTKFVPVNTGAVTDYRAELLAVWTERRLVTKAADWMRRQIRSVDMALAIARNVRWPGRFPIKYREARS